MPGFEKEYIAKRDQGFALLGVNEDAKRTDMDDYLAKKPVSFPVLIDSEAALMKRLGVRVLPTTVLVGGDGKIRLVNEGVLDYMNVFIDTQLKSAELESNMRGLEIKKK
jgi:cytochrome c biogenesis protein CcmG/thiol:disulfide interchange protein DsbE